MSVEKSTRQQIVDAIRPLLPIDWQVVPFTDEPGTITGPVVMTEATNIDPGAVAGTYAIEHHVYVLTPKGAQAEAVTDAVDDAVLLVLHALRPMRAVTHGSAARLVFPGGFPCWDITIQIEAVVKDDAETEG